MVHNGKKKSSLDLLGILPGYIGMSRYRSLRLREESNAIQQSGSFVSPLILVLHQNQTLNFS